MRWPHKSYATATPSSVHSVPGAGPPSLLTSMVVVTARIALEALESLCGSFVVTTSMCLNKLRTRFLIVPILITLKFR